MSFNPDRINIHELTVEEPERKETSEVPFDPNNIFSDWDWASLKNEANSSTVFAYSSMAIINKEKIADSYNLIKEKVKQKIKNDDDLSSIAWAVYAFPELLDEIPGIVIDEAVKKNEHWREEEKRDGDWRHYAEPMAWMTVLKCNRELTSEDLEKIEEEFQKQKKSQNGAYMIEMAAAIAIIDPDYGLEFSFEENEAMAKFIKKWIQDKVSGCEWFMFSAMAKIVADKVREQASKKQLKSETPVVPEVKQF